MKFVKMTNQASRLVIAGLLAWGTTAAFADTFDVKVTGTVKPGACTPTLAGGGTFDYGLIGSAQLSPTAPTLLAILSDSITITCDAAARVALTAQDNRDGTGALSGNINFFGMSKSDNVQFGLGTASGKNIGGFAFRFRKNSFQADGAAVDSIYSSTKGTTWTASDGVVDNTGGYESWAKKGQTVPVAAKVFSGTLDVQAAIDKTSNLDLSQEINLDGLATVSLVYL
ncbi:DUF1120 domain-containing protein [Burkholderia cenocepacia]|uniref:DUF1120 domain-containing protein n=1 Tax=Burkholderia cenocepacia TaxID=95486 RepID=UPI001B8E111D|nr:DUF1120 domain-containing protein [Burkholderia cenocepacia]MBR7947442.1 DUF1120 domain-containing protein [Burkholderia cenocepacia]MDN7535958.1 DUF1120 domain-containing protein [Burkholderia cenocepacia]QUN53192.1 DUF1120 domain-containing protein [Burkholderia cenocepacia]HEM7803086.1 DUF1120 domain-containing protein [Burkholderia cenocepacia]